MDLEKYLYDNALKIIEGFNDEDIYAISFFVYANEAYEYKGISNFPEFGVGYNTEKACNNAPLLSEERWNYAFWLQNNISIIEADENDEGASILYQWYKSKGIKKLGYEDFENDYDNEGNYIGKGPVGYYELLEIITKVAKELQTKGIIKANLGNIPIIIHQLEDCWYVEEATKKANPNGEADAFLKAFKEGYPDKSANKYPATFKKGFIKIVVILLLGYLMWILIRRLMQ